MHPIIQAVISELQGNRFEPGTVVAHPDIRLTHELVKYEGDVAVIEWDGEYRRVPAAELFDPNAASRRVREIVTADAVAKIRAHKGN